jgi:thiamine biosynthesis lipoprotein
MRAVATKAPGVHRVERIMGMPIVAEIRDEEVDPQLLDEVFGWFRWVDETFSTYKPESQVSRLARAELPLEDAAPEVRDVLRRCDELRLETDGYFDAHATGPLDPSGLVKGWAVDRAAAILDAAGLREHAVSAGGDMRLRGGPWRVGIQHPRERHRLAAVVEATDLAVATSGAYARGEHVVDPHTGRPPAGVMSVTVVGPDLATADAYATAAFAMGADAAPHWVARLQGYEAMIVLDDDVVLSTGGFPDD